MSTRPERTQPRTGARGKAAAEWPEWATDYERKFGKAGRYLAMIERPVWTPKGMGWLMQYFTGECRVLLDKTEYRAWGEKWILPMTRFVPEDIRPIEGYEYRATNLYSLALLAQGGNARRRKPPKSARSNDNVELVGGASPDECEALRLGF